MRQLRKRKRKTINRKSLAIASGLILLILVCYSPIIFGNYKLSYTNYLYEVLPFKSLGADVTAPLLSDPADNFLPVAYASIHKLIFTFWLPGVGIGAAQSMAQYLSVLAGLYILPLDIGLTVISMAKVIIAFSSMYLFMKNLKTEPIGAFCAAGSFALCSTMLMWQGWPHSEVTMLAPLLFLVTDLLLNRYQTKYLVFGSIVVFFMLTAAMPTYVAYFMYLCGCYLLYNGFKTYPRDWKKLIRYFFSFGIFVVLGTLMSLPYTLDLLQTVGGNGYSSSRAGLANATFSTDYLRTLFYPYIRDSEMSLHINESTLYTGILAVVTLPMSFVNYREKNKITFFLGSIAILAILLFTNSLSIVYQHLPLINTSLKLRLIVLMNFCLCICFGLNIGNWFKDKEKSLMSRIMGGGSLFLSGAIFYLGYQTVTHVKLDASMKNQVSNSVIIVGTAVIFLTLCLIFKNRYVNNVGKIIIAILVIFDMGYFGSNYLPLISKDAAVIPPKTESISYLQQNTQNEEKMVVKGNWTFFASSNVYYNLRDIRGHHFVFTNQDIHNYYNGINNDINVMTTSIGFNTISNYNLLKYLGVKYEVYPSDGVSVSDRPEAVGGTALIENVDSRKEIKQTFTSTKNNLNMIKVLAGTYNGAFKDEEVTLSLIDMSTGEVIREADENLMGQPDNYYLTFSFEDIPDSLNKTYQIVLSNTLKSPNKIAYYVSQEENYPGELSENGYGGNLVIALNYDEGNVVSFNDGLSIKNLGEFSQQIQLTDTVEVLKTEAEVLQSMESDYQKTTTFFSDENEYPQMSVQSKLTSDEKIFNIERKLNGNISFTADVNENRIVLINEYNDGHWKAFIDGKETPVYKGNYIMRAIQIPEGKHQVVLTYHNSSIVKSFFVAGITGILVVILLIYNKKIDKFYKKSSHEK